MELSNDSPFSPFVFESIDQDDAPINAVFCRGTFLIQNECRLLVADEQEAVVLTDVYRTEPLISSVQVDTDLVPRKLAADITLSSIAHAPANRPLDRWQVKVRVGEAESSMNVTGQRQWEYGLLTGWRMTAPQPASGVPIHYELAFGGRFLEDGQHVTCEFNPVGRGFVNLKKLSSRQPILAPQIEAVSQSISELGCEYQPVGLGPIAKHWLPRREQCGTADEQWKENRWPMRPLDFDFRYYNSAPAPLVYPGYLRGDEEVRLEGLSPNGALLFQLPEIAVTLFALDRDQHITLEYMKLDTLHMDTTTMRAYLTWRLTFPKTADLNMVQIVAEPLRPTSPTMVSTEQSLI